MKPVFKPDPGDKPEGEPLETIFSYAAQLHETRLSKGERLAGTIEGAQNLLKGIIHALYGIGEDQKEK